MIWVGQFLWEYKGGIFNRKWFIICKYVDSDRFGISLVIRFSINQIYVFNSMRVKWC